MQTLEILKTYQSDRPMNSADISPIFDHVVVGGGQEASQVRAAAGCHGIHLLRASCQAIQAHCLVGRHGGAPTCGAAVAVQVTLTSSRQGKFETDFYHTVFEERFGRCGAWPTVTVRF